MGEIYIAVEGGDLNKFKRLISELSEKDLSKGLEEYRGATPLHWAALHGRKEMVSFICRRILSYRQKPNESDQGHDNCSAIVNARDDFGFTPLHLAVISSLWQFDIAQGTVTSSTVEENGQTCSEMIEELCKFGIPHYGPSSSQSEFRLWNISKDHGICEDDNLSNTKLYPIVLGVYYLAPPYVIGTLLESSPEEAFVTTDKYGCTILHNAATWNLLSKFSPSEAWAKLESNLLKRLNSPSNSKAVNIRNNKRQAPLHEAVRIRSLRWVEALLGCDHINLDSRDRDGHTPRELAASMLKDFTRDSPETAIIDLIDCADPAGLYRETEMQQRERQVYVDAANAILVGAALIASASFGAWLQPPLGYKEYYEFPVTEGGAQNTYESFVAIKQYWIIQMVWIFNSLSFFFSLATVIAGADAALPQQGLLLREAVISVRKAVKWASWLLSVAIVFVICTFTTMGFSVLPHIEKYKINMYCTVLVGLLVCGFVLVRFLRKLSSYGNGRIYTDPKPESKHPRSRRET